MSSENILRRRSVDTRTNGPGRGDRPTDPNQLSTTRAAISRIVPLHATNTTDGTGRSTDERAYVDGRGLGLRCPRNTGYNRPIEANAVFHPERRADASCRGQLPRIQRRSGSGRRGGRAVEGGREGRKGWQLGLERVDLSNQRSSEYGQSIGPSDEGREDRMMAVIYLFTRFSHNTVFRENIVIIRTILRCADYTYSPL